MEIQIVRGAGVGKTTLSAFDKALEKAGVNNYNLVTLSSIIPAGTKIVRRKKYQTPGQEYGYKLYVVKAEIRSDQAGKSLAAGLGWFQTDDGRGVFVEHESMADTRKMAAAETEARIKNSLSDLCRFRRFKFEEKDLRFAIASAKIIDKPTSVLTIAIYKSEDWT